MSNSEEETALVWEGRSNEAILQEVLPSSLAAEEARALEEEMPAIRKRFEGGSEVVRKNLSEITALLRASESDAERLANQGTFKSLWNRLTGRNARDRQDIEQNLQRVQARALCVTERLLEKQEYLEHATRFLGARLEMVSMENLKMKAVLVRLGQRIFDRVEGLEDRVTRLEQRSDNTERRVAMCELFQSGFSPSAQIAYNRIQNPLERVLRLTMDFTEASGGDWRPIDFRRLEMMAEREANVTDDTSLSIAEVVVGVLKLREGAMVRWIGAESLEKRLMAQTDEGAEELRSFYPMHFLLQRPRWFMKQGLPRTGLQLVADEVANYGLDPEKRLGLWEIARILLEERLAWSMESGELVVQKPEEPKTVDVPAVRDLGATTVRTVKLGDVSVQDIYLVAGEIVALGWQRRGADLSLLHVQGEETLRIPRQPNWNRPELEVVPGGTSLWALSEDHRGADGLIFDGNSASWQWRSATLPTGSIIDGIAASGTSIAGWRMNRIYLKDSKGTLYEQPSPRRIIAGSASLGAIYILDGTELFCWRPASDMFLPLFRLPAGMQGLKVQASPTGLSAVVYAKDGDGSEALIAAHLRPNQQVDQYRQYFQAPIARFFCGDDDQTLVQSQDGTLLAWSHTGEDRLRAVAPSGHKSFDLLASDAQGNFVGLERHQGDLVLFHL